MHLGSSFVGLFLCRRGKSRLRFHLSGDLGVSRRDASVGVVIEVTFRVAGSAMVVGGRGGVARCHSGRGAVNMTPRPWAVETTSSHRPAHGTTMRGRSIKRSTVDRSADQCVLDTT